MFMYRELVFGHSVVRWLVLVLLLLSIVVAWRGLIARRPFTKAVDKLRHWTATIAHIQLMIGIVLYVKSPFVKTTVFFGIVHIATMLCAIAILTIGSAMAKRKVTDRDKYRTILLWYSIALLLILAAIPWPFSPWAARPWFRNY